MSLKNNTSLFSRAFKRTFNSGKYQDLVGIAGNNPTYIPYVAHTDARIGRFMLNFGVIVMAFVMYLEPSYWHETFGHVHHPTYDLISANLSGKELELNEQILHRHHEEQQLEHFMHPFQHYTR